MKKISGSIVLMVIILSCGGKSTKDKPAASDDLSSNPVYQKGLALVSKSNCYTCHRINEAFTGPAYADVAKKYADADDKTKDLLAERIIKGSNGIWGDAYMTPHPDLSKEDAKAMVEYVLLLK